MGPRGDRAGRPPLRLTRRGRVVLFLLCLLLVAVAAGLAAPAIQAAQSPPPTVVVVGPDDTLWSIAARHAPGRDPYGIIEEIRRLNDLPDTTVHPGHRLVLP